MINYREKLFHSKYKQPSPLNIRAYKLFRNRINREIKKSKKQYFKNYFQFNLNNMKKTWDEIKNIINPNNKSNQKITELSYKGNKITDQKEIVETFNDFFTNIGPELDKTIPTCLKPNSSSIYLGPRSVNSLLISPTNPQEIIKIIENLDDSKSSGPSLIPIKLIKIASNYLSTPLSDLCNSFPRRYLS